MAYLKPNLFIFIKNNGMPISAMIEKVAFRKYWGKRKDKNTGKFVKARRSMPYAICKVMTSKDPEIALGAQFTIVGYKLQNVTVKGKTALAFHNKYEVEFADELGNEWVRRLILEESADDPNDNYEPQVGDLVQYVGPSEGIFEQIGVILGSELLYTGYGTRRRKAMVFHIKFPSKILSLKPRHFKVIKKVNKNT